MTIRIGVNPLSWCNSDIPSLGATISVEQVLSEAALLGYRGIELEDRLVEPLKQSEDCLARRNLQLVGGWHATHLLENSMELEQARLAEHIAFLKRFGGEVVILAECSGSVHRKYDTPVSWRPRMRLGEWERLTTRLEALHRQIAEAGLVSAYHHHMGTVIQTSDEIDTLMERTESLGLLLDTGHLAYAGADPGLVLAEHSARVTHVHIKNVRYPVVERLLEEDSSFARAIVAGVFTVPGDDGRYGREGIDFAPIFQCLVENGYQGWLIMEAEQDPAKADPLTYAGLGKKAMSFELARARLKATICKDVLVEV